jgi:hypothetical protein
MFGAWFEIERRGNKWQAVRLAHTELKLQGHALPGLNVKTLIETGEPTNAELVERARSESRASQHSQHDPPPHQNPPVQPPNDPTSVIVENTFFTFFYFFYKKVIKSYKKLKKVEKKKHKKPYFFYFFVKK